jgi:hypothetical protein
LDPGVWIQSKFMNHCQRWELRCDFLWHRNNWNQLDQGQVWGWVMGEIVVWCPVGARDFSQSWGLPVVYSVCARGSLREDNMVRLWSCPLGFV